MRITSVKSDEMSMSVMSTRGVMTSEAVVSPNRRMPSSISLSSEAFTSVISSACESSSVVTSWLFLVTTLLTIPELRTSSDDSGWNSAERKETPPTANRAHLRFPELAISFGRISPKRRIRNVNITVCNTKLNTSFMPANTGPSAKLQSMTMVTLTRLLAIRIVASNRSGCLSRRIMDSPFGSSSNSSSCEVSSEKYASSLPDTNPDTNSASRAHAKAII